MERKKMKVAGRPKYIQRMRVRATLQGLRKMERRHRINFVEDATETKYNGSDIRRWAHAVSIKLFSKNRIDDIKTHQEKLEALAAPWKESEIYELLEDAEEYAVEVINLINTGDTAKMSEDYLQEMIHGFEGIVDDMPFISSGNCHCCKN